MGTLKQAVDRVAAAKTAIGAAITAKGGTVAAGDGLEEFAADIGTITNQYTASDEGKVVSGGTLVSQTSTTATVNGTIDTTTNNEVVVNVPNTYTAGDEGKVVSGGALVAQTAYPSEITANNTYDTTNYNSVTVNMPSLPSDFKSITKKYGEGTINYLYWIETDNCYYLMGKIYFISTVSPIYIYNLPSNIMSTYKSGVYIEDGTYVYSGTATSPVYNTETSIKIPISSYTQYKTYYFMFVFGK